MLRLILTATALMAACPAMASSIEVISGSRTSNNSMTTVSCEACPPLKIDARKQIYNVPVLDSGLQKVEIRDTGEEKQLIRTEKWFGGSPVVRVSVAKTWMPDETGTIVAVRPSADAIGDGIDHSATTAAVGSGQKDLPAITGASPPVAADASGTAPVAKDFADFSLRTN